MSDQYATFNFFHILDDRKSLLIPLLSISDQNATFLFLNFVIKMAGGGHFGSPIWAILDDRKSLLIAFLAISDQHATFFFTKWLPAAILDDRKSFRSKHNFSFFWFIFQNSRRRPIWMTENHFWLHYSPFQINMQLFFHKMAADSHFVKKSFTENH